MEDELTNKHTVAENDLNKAQQLMQLAEDADEGFDFSLAYRLFIQAAIEFDNLKNVSQANVCLVRAATNLEKFQIWRGHSALWEYLGNRLGNLANPEFKFPNPNKPGQSGMYHIVSWNEWRHPYNGYYGNDIRAEQLHQQAWAYTWGGDEAEAEQRYGIAGKLFRKAAISYELSKWGDRPIEKADDVWKKHRLEERYGNKWKYAARFYFKAMYNYTLDKGKNPDEAFLFVAYEPNQVGWPSKTSKESKSNEAVYEKADDIERMIRCWRNYGETKNNVVKALQECCRQLSILQDQFAHIGKRNYQKKIYHIKKKLELEIEAIENSWKYPFNWLYYHLTGSGSSIKRTSLSIIPIYIIIFPSIYYLGGLFKHGINSSTPINFNDAILFSLANAVSISINDYTVESFIGSIIQTLNALSALLFVGYIVWLMTRSFEE